MNCVFAVKKFPTHFEGILPQRYSSINSLDLCFDLVFIMHLQMNGSDIIISNHNPVVLSVNFLDLPICHSDPPACFLRIVKNAKLSFLQQHNEPLDYSSLLILRKCRKCYVHELSCIKFEVRNIGEP